MLQNKAKHENNNTHLTRINLINIISCVDFIQIPGLCKTFNNILSSVSVSPSGIRHQVAKRGVPDLIITGDTYFSFPFFPGFSPFFTAW